MGKWLIVVMTLALLACGQPTREELLESQQAKYEYCEAMRKDIEASADRPLIRATLQENYNRECLGQTYPDQVQ